jgi:hypothetical protein
MDDKVKKYPEDYFLGLWIGLGIAIFSRIGIPLTIITENLGFIGIGPALGVAIGVSIGKSIEKKYKQEGRIQPLTELEQTRKKNTVIAGIIILILGIFILILLFFL